MPDYALLSVNEMRAAEKAAMQGGVESYTLMTRAGEAVARVAARRYEGREFLVLAGPGNNGGDGFVAARALAAMGRKVEVATARPLSELKGDAARAAADYKGSVIPLEKTSLAGNPVIVDALFGTGLARPIAAKALDILRSVNERHMDVVAVDIPSGVHGDSGEVLGIAPKAAITVTFARMKYGHVLLPGRILCGEVIVADIGIDDDAVRKAAPCVDENQKRLWQASLRFPEPRQHKYHRGHTLVLGGEAIRAGAAKLAAIAALRSGSGLVSIVCRQADLMAYAATACSLMTELRRNWAGLLSDPRKNTVVVGPGAGVTPATRAAVLAALRAKKRAVLDADALTAFVGQRTLLFSHIKSPVILTPHEGEFAKLFPQMTGSKLERALKAAALTRAIVVLKGYDTVIASPSGRAAVNTNATADLATAGSGDVLSGVCGGLLASGMEAFEAACAAVWIHAEAGASHGTGLISEDLPARLPAVLQTLTMPA